MNYDNKAICEEENTKYGSEPFNKLGLGTFEKACTNMEFGLWGPDLYSDGTYRVLVLRQVETKECFDDISFTAIIKEGEIELSSNHNSTVWPIDKLTQKDVKKWVKSFADGPKELAFNS